MQVKAKNLPVNKTENAIAEIFSSKQVITVRLGADRIFPS
jgi:hypothetical protein